MVRFTVSETADVVGDVAFLHRVRHPLDEFPGQNRILMRIVTLDGQRPVVEWRAYASRALRLALGYLLAGALRPTPLSASRALDTRSPRRLGLWRSSLPLRPRRDVMLSQHRVRGSMTGLLGGGA